jgi:hypothetical protein
MLKYALGLFIFLAFIATTNAKPADWETVIGQVIGVKKIKNTLVVRLKKIDAEPGTLPLRIRVPVNTPTTIQGTPATTKDICEDQNLNIKLHRGKVVDVVILGGRD